MVVSMGEEGCNFGTNIIMALKKSFVHKNLFYPANACLHRNNQWFKKSWKKWQQRHRCKSVFLFVGFEMHPEASLRREKKTETEEQNDQEEAILPEQHRSETFPFRLPREPQTGHHEVSNQWPSSYLATRGAETTADILSSGSVFPLPCTPRPTPINDTHSHHLPDVRQVPTRRFSSNGRERNDAESSCGDSGLATATTDPNSLSGVSSCTVGGNLSADSVKRTFRC